MAIAKYTEAEQIALEYKLFESKYNNNLVLKSGKTASEVYTDMIRDFSTRFPKESYLKIWDYYLENKSMYAEWVDWIPLKLNKDFALEFKKIVLATKEDIALGKFETNTQKPNNNNTLLIVGGLALLGVGAYLVFKPKKSKKKK